ncbi:MAG: lamin tail domain-containing protein [Crocinitomicaceae bacterium]|nr:lamin tail domain-containing protein [Crocinitomicaceae bacterium]
MNKLLFSFTLLIILPFQSQIFINEACNSNGTVYLLPNGSSPDWIELYNSSATAQSLQGLYLSDNRASLSKWAFPPTSIPANGFTTLLANGNGTSFLVDHFESPIDHLSQWSYILPNAAIPNWNTTVFDASGWSQGKTSIGYGDADDSTDIIGPATTIYARINFNITNFNDIVKTIFDIDYDDGFVAYLNGVEIAREGLAGNPPSFDELAADHEAQLYQGGNLSSYDLDMSVISNLLQNGTNVLAVEIHNADPNSSDLTCRPFLTFGLATSQQQFNGYMHPFFNSPQAGILETNFAIATAGETLYLSNASGMILDSLVVPDLEANMSVGKKTDGSNSWFIFPTPTPNATNNVALSFLGYEEKPDISLVGGIYANSVSVPIINHSTQGGIIRYTINGDDPDGSSPVASGPITISSNTVLKVRCFPNGSNRLASPIEAETFLINENSTIPIVSLTIDQDDLLGPNGIFDNWWTDWKRPCVIEYFNPDGSKQFESKASVKPDGGAGGSRSNPQHSVTVESANTTFGTGENIHYPLFPEKPYVDDIQAIYIRNGSNFWNQYHQRDATFMRVMRKSHVNSQAYRPANVFLNGQYFGVYELREKANETYFNENYGNHVDSLDLLSVSYWYGSVLRTVKGSDSSFFNMVNFITTADKTNPSYLSQCDKRLDLKNYTDYIAAELWYGNTDWIYNNMKIARTRTTDNKWRFFLQDLEWGLGGWTNYNDNMFDWFEFSNQPNPYYEIHSNLMMDSTYRNHFINRYADLMNTTLHQNTYTPIINQLYEELLPEMPRHFAYWTGDVAGGMNTYTYNRDVILGQFNNRNTAVRNQMLNYYNLQNTVNLTLSTIPANAGYIKISTIIPDSLPWTGVYFHGNPVTITAVANPGFTFNHWENNINLPSTLLSNASISVDIATDDYFTAVFSGSPTNTSLTISEINYRPDASLDGGNWIELHNFGNSELNLTGWTLKSDDFYNAYSFSDGVKIPSGGYLVVAQDTQLFHAIYPTVTNVVGNLRFGFENNMDSIYIFRPNSDTLLAMKFTNDQPFPRCADGFGRTLENKQTNAISLDSLSWFCGCIAGSPGEAYFPCDEPVIFSEFNLGKSTIANNAEDWIELKNNTNNAIDFSGFTLKDEKQDHIFSLNGLSLEPGEYAVVVKDSSIFYARHPNFGGKALYQLPYGISSNDALRLYDFNGTLLQSVVFDTSSAWPQAPFNSDFTFEYLEANANQALASNWFQGCEGGSPGRAFSACPILPDNAFAWLYPNPSSGQFTIAIDNQLIGNAGTDIQVFDLSGKLLYSQEYPVELGSVESIPMDLSFLRASMYLIRVSKASQSVTLRFIKD